MSISLLIDQQLSALSIEASCISEKYIAHCRSSVREIYFPISHLKNEVGDVTKSDNNCQFTRGNGTISQVGFAAKLSRCVHYLVAITQSWFKCLKIFFLNLNHDGSEAGEVSFVHTIRFNCQIILKFGIEHGSITAVLCAKFQNYWMLIHTLWVNEFTRDLGWRWVSDGYPILHSTPAHYIYDLDDLPTATISFRVLQQI